MGGGHISKDSWSRSEAQSMLYSAVRNPAAPYRPPKTSATQDTLESIQQRLQNEMLHRVQNKGLELPHESYVAVVQVGKYVFLAVMLPVYLGLYAVPRWFLVKALPQCFGAVKSQFVTIGRFVTERTKRVADLMKGLLDQLLGDAMRMSKEKARNVWGHLSSKVNQFSKGLSKGISQGVATLAALFERMKHAAAFGAANVLDQAERNAQATNQWVAVYARFIAKTVFTKTLKALQGVDDRVLTPFIKLMIPPFELLAEAFNSIKSSVLAAREKMLKKIKEIMKLVVALAEKAIKNGIAQTKRGVEKLAAPLVDWLREKRVDVDAYRQKIKHAVIERFGQGMAGIKAKVKIPIFAGLWKAKHSLLVVPSWVKLLIKPGLKTVSKRLNEGFSQQKQSLAKTKQAAKNLAGSTAATFHEIVTFVIKRVLLLRGLITHLVHLVRHLFLWAFKYIMVVSRRAKSSSVAIFKGIVFLAARIHFAGHVVIALICVACICGFRLMRQITEPIRSLDSTPDL